MAWKIAVAAGLALAVGFGAGSLTGGGDREPEPAPTATVTETVTEAAAEPERASGLPQECDAAFVAAEDVVRFTPEALARLRNAYERAQPDDGSQGGPPPSSTFSQLQSQSQSMAGRFSSAVRACEAAAGR